MTRIKQVVAIAIGLLFGVLGGITLARAGVGDLSQHTSVAGFHHTTLLGYIEIAYGVLVLLAGGVYPTERTGFTLLGILALGFGIVVVAAHEPLHGSLGVHAANGWLYIIAGAVTLALALVPTGLGGRPSAADRPRA